VNSQVDPGILISGCQIAQTIIQVHTPWEKPTSRGLSGLKDLAGWIGIFILRQGSRSYLGLFQALFVGAALGRETRFFKAQEVIWVQLLVRSLFGANWDEGFCPLLDCTCLGRIAYSHNYPKMLVPLLA
jgi:hypothetical protein